MSTTEKPRPVEGIVVRFLRWLNLACSQQPCRGEVAGIYYFTRGCICNKNKLQKLCAQHFIKAEPVSRMYCLKVILPIKGYSDV